MLLMFVEQVAAACGKSETGCEITIVNAGKQAKPATGSSDEAH
jgi:hypothetical protein